jgi:hypothetical protein
MEVDKKIFNFGYEHSTQTFPEYDPNVINSIFEFSSVRLFKLISCLYNGNYIDEGDEKRMRILKNLVAEFYVIPLLSNLYPELYNLVESFDDFIIATKILNRVISGYNNYGPKKMFNIDCSMFNIDEKLASKILMSFGYSKKIYKDKIIVNSLVHRINEILNDNSSNLYFLALHFFNNKKSVSSAIKNLNYLEFYELFETVCEDEIMESISNEILLFENLEESNKSINKILVNHIVACYNKRVKS